MLIQFLPTYTLSALNAPTFLPISIYCLLILLLSCCGESKAQNAGVPQGHGSVHEKRVGRGIMFLVHNDVGIDSITVVAYGKTVRTQTEVIIDQEFSSCPKDIEAGGEVKLLPDVYDYIITIRDCNGNYQKWRGRTTTKDDYDDIRNWCKYLGNTLTIGNIRDMYDLKKNPVVNGNFMFRPVVGYNFPIANGILSSKMDMYGNVTGVYGSGAQGIIAGADLGYKIKPFITLVVGARGIISVPPVRTFNYVTPASGNSFTDNFTGEFKTAILSLGADFNVLSRSRFKPFAGFGMDLGVGGRIKRTELIEVQNGYNVVTDNITLLSSMQFNPGFGAYAELGTEYMLSHHITLFAMVRLDAISLLPNKLLVSSEIDNGVDVTSLLTASQKEIDFVKTLLASANTNPYSPAQQLAENFPISGISINLGFTFWF